MEELYKGTTDIIAEADSVPYPDALPMNAFQRLYGAVVSPIQTLKAIINKPTIIVMLLVLMLLPVATYFLRMGVYTADYDKVMAATMAANPTMTAEAAQMAKDIFTSPLFMSSTLLFSLASSWFFGMLIMFAVIKIMKGKGSFKQIASITLHSNIFALLSYILATASSYLTGTMHLNTSVTAITNLILPAIKGTFVYGILRGMDLFVILGYVFAGVGIYMVSKLSKQKVGIMMAVMFVIYLLMNANSLMIL